VQLGGDVQGIGGSATRRHGGDATLVTWGATVHAALVAADRLAADGVHVGVIDARWINPFDIAALSASLERTGRLVVAHEANLTGAFSAQVVAQVAESGIRLLAPPIRVGAPDSRVPAAPTLLSAVIPDAGKIEEAVRRVMAYGTRS
jgi:pyruvate dehydrogenase E1 component beta subunit